MESMLTLKISTCISVITALTAIITSIVMYRNKINKLEKENAKGGTTLILPEALTNALANNQNSQSEKSMYQRDLNNIYSRMNRMQEQSTEAVRQINVKLDTLSDHYVSQTYCNLIQKTLRPTCKN